MRNKVEVRLPYLVQTRSGAYFVEYRAYNPASDKLERFRVYKGFQFLKSHEAAVKHADKIIATLSVKLKAGWRPWKDSDYIYRDEVEYHHLGETAGRDKQDKSHIRNYFSEYLSWKKNDVSPKSFESYQSKIRLFTIWLEKNNYEHLRVGEISNDIMIEFFNYLIAKRKLDKLTVAKYKQNLYNLFDYLKRKKLITEIPLDYLPKATKLVDAAARPMTDRHIKLYLDYISEKDPQLLLASMFQLLLLCRPNRELRLMQIQDVDLVKKVAYIRSETAKTEKRMIIMPNALVELAEKYDLHRYPGHYYIFGRGGKPGPDCVGVNYFNRKFSEAKKELSLPDTYKFYGFKHTGAGKLLESGATLAELMSHLGHSRFESTIRYVRRHFGERSEKIVNFKPDFLDGLKL